MKPKIRSYESDAITVDYDLARCIHAAECVHGLPTVFDPERRPWIDPGQEADTGIITEVIDRCPTGALSYRHGDASGPEPAGTNSVHVEADGPLYVRGDLRIDVGDEEPLVETRVALCRCGLSRNKPFCDNAHVAGKFSDPGLVAEAKLKSAPDGAEADPLEVKPVDDGPVLISGPVTLEATDGTRVEGSGGALCRCGHSANKPFCDGTHREIGFRST